LSKLDDQIHEVVEEKLKNNPKAPTVELHKKATKISMVDTGAKYRTV